MSTSSSYQKMNKILCPALRIGVTEGELKPCEKGTVTESELRDYMSYLGWKEKSVISKFIDKAKSYDPNNEVINICEFRGTGFDHGSSSGIINCHHDDNAEGYYPDRMALMMKYANANNELGYRELAHFAGECHRNPVNFGSAKGRAFLMAEFANILAIFGRKNENGKLVLKTEDVDALWKEARFPDGWEKPPKPFYGTFTTIINVVRMHFLLWFTKPRR